MLKIEKNKDGDTYISGDQADLKDLQYQISEVIDHQTAFTKAYYDFKWDAHETKEKSLMVTVILS